MNMVKDLSPKPAKAFPTPASLHTCVAHSISVTCSFYSFHAEMSKIKGRNCLDLMEAKDIKKRWQENTEEIYKKNLNDPDSQDGVITHLEPDILECKVKWALGRITTKKLVEMMEFQLSYFKS